MRVAELQHLLANKEDIVFVVHQSESESVWGCMMCGHIQNDEASTCKCGYSRIRQIHSHDWEYVEPESPES